ncbi:MAG: polyphosphate kinase 2 family protein [Hyphomicrobiaceae bacterium]
MGRPKFSTEPFLVKPGVPLDMAVMDPGWKDDPELEPFGIDKLHDDAKKILKKRREELAEVQERLYADNRYSVLLIFQGRDAAGKDSTIEHVMSGVNPQGCQVFSFKAPSKEELDHNFLWRGWKAVPERGRIGIFNRSHYEEVLVVRVHPAFLAGQGIPEPLVTENVWQERFEDINAFEKHLVRNGTVVIKFFLNVSRDEQKKRFLKRLDQEAKNWKFSHRDLAERAHWDAYTHAFNEMLTHTSTEWAPWYVIPAENKDVMRAIVSRIVVDRLDELDLKFPDLSDEEKERLTLARDALMSEGS